MTRAASEHTVQWSSVRPSPELGQSGKAGTLPLHSFYKARQTVSQGASEDPRKYSESKARPPSLEQGLFHPVRLLISSKQEEALTLPKAFGGGDIFQRRNLEVSASHDSGIRQHVSPGQQDRKFISNTSGKEQKDPQQNQKHHLHAALT